MKNDNPFAKLGTIDQQLFQDTFAKQPEGIDEKSSPPPTSPTKKPESKTPTVNDTMIPRYHDTTKPSNHDTAIPSGENDIFEVVRKAVKQIGKEAATHRFTLDEKNHLADIEYNYKRQGIRTSENEIARIAINYFIEDYRKNGDLSLLV